MNMPMSPNTRKRPMPLILLPVGNRQKPPRTNRQTNTVALPSCITVPLVQPISVKRVLRPPMKRSPSLHLLRRIRLLNPQPPLHLKSPPKLFCPQPLLLHNFRQILKALFPCRKLFLHKSIPFGLLLSRIIQARDIDTRRVNSLSLLGGVWLVDYCVC